MSQQKDIHCDTLTASRHVSSSATPTSASHLTNKAYVDSVNSGDVKGPDLSTDNAIVRFDGVDGSTIKNSLVTVTDTGNVATSGTVTTTNATASTSTATGALVVTGGAGVGGNAYVGGVARVTSAFSSSSTTSGALVVTGGAGIGGATYVGGVARVLDTTTSSSTTSGALVVTGGAGIGGDVYIGGNAVSNTAPSSGSHLTNKTYVDGITQYVPTTTFVTTVTPFLNIASVGTLRVATYSRIGDIVTGVIHVELTTTAAGKASITFTLPVPIPGYPGYPLSIGAGTTTGAATEVVMVYASSGGGASVIWNDDGTTSFVTFHFSYTV